MSDHMKLTVISGGETVFAAEAVYINIPTDFGSFAIHGNSEPMTCSVAPGNIRCDLEGGGVLIRTGRGIADISPAETIIMVSQAEVLG